MDAPRDNTIRRPAYLNVVLTVIAVLLALLVVDGRLARNAGAADAMAQPDDPHGSAQALVSAGEQRKMMIAELRRMASRLERIESKLSSGISVKVTEMPAKTDGK